MKHFTLKNILIVVVLLLLAIQFVRIDKDNPPADLSKDFLEITQPDDDITYILKTACYDCHSNNTRYPWYSNVAPVSWWVKDHIDHGRKHLNFSTWGDYSTDRQDHKLEEIIEEVSQGEMPLFSYTIAHWDARLSDTQRKQLTDWVEKLRTRQ